MTKMHFQRAAEMGKAILNGDWRSNAPAWADTTLYDASTTDTMNPRDLHGRTLALVIGRDIMGVDILSSIRWRVYGYGGGALWLRSVDSGVKSKLTLREFEELVDTHRLIVCREGDAQ